MEAEALAERFEIGWWYAELHRLRGVFLTALGTEEAQIDASFCEAIRIAKQQKAVSLNEMDRSNLCGIPWPKSQRVRRAWVPTISLVTSCSSLPFVHAPPATIFALSAEFAPDGTTRVCECGNYFA
jgi:hypothetical protein